MKYTLEYLKENKVAVNCRTVEEASKVCKILFDRFHPEAPSIAHYFHGDSLCFDRFGSKSGYSGIEYYTARRFEIIPASEFLQDWEGESEVPETTATIIAQIRAENERHTKTIDELLNKLK